MISISPGGTTLSGTPGPPSSVDARVGREISKAEAVAPAPSEQMGLAPGAPAEGRRRRSASGAASRFSYTRYTEQGLGKGSPCREWGGGKREKGERRGEERWEGVKVSVFFGPGAGLVKAETSFPECGLHPRDQVCWALSLPKRGEEKIALVTNSPYIILPLAVLAVDPSAVRELAEELECAADGAVKGLDARFFLVEEDGQPLELPAEALLWGVPTIAEVDEAVTRAVNEV